MCIRDRLLAAQPMGFYSPQSLVADGRRHGVTVLRPDVQASLAKAGLERVPDGAGSGTRVPDGVGPGHGGGTYVARLVQVDPTLAVRMGLDSVRGVGQDVATALVAERTADGRFAGLRDPVSYTHLTLPQIEALATAGALGCFGVD